MIDVASLQQFDFFTNFTLCAGESGMNRTISNIVILDHEGLSDYYQGFHQGDFVITNLLYAKDDTAKIYHSFERLMNIGVSAIAVKTVFFENLPEDVLALAEKNHTPVFLFHTIYIEDVLLSISDLLRSNTNYNYYESLIDNMLVNSDFISSSANSLLQNLHMESYALLASLYLTFHNPIDDFSLQRLLNTIMQKNISLTSGEHFGIMKYKKGIFILYASNTQVHSMIVQQKFKHIMQSLELPLGELYVGINDNLLSITKLSIILQRALYANKACKINQFSQQFYSQLDLHNLYMPMQDNVYLQEYLQDVYHALLRGNTKHSKEALIETLKQYVLHDFSIDLTSQALYQHPNTIRYRITKLKEALHTPSDATFQLLATLIVHNLL